MRFASLGSGSRGNGTLVEYKDTCVLIDCGFSMKETVIRLERLGKTLHDLKAILVTHEHGDHFRGVGPCSRKANIPVMMTRGTRLAMADEKLQYLTEFNSHEAFDLGDLKVIPVPVPHDAREPSQFVLVAGEARLGLVTDVGYVTPFMVEQFSHCDALLLESNHDTTMLANGPYPRSVKERVAGNWGHLNNEQAAEFLRLAEFRQLQHLVIAHISEQNNSLSKAQEVLDPFTSQAQNVVYADQSNGFDWLTIS